MGQKGIFVLGTLKSWILNLITTYIVNFYEIITKITMTTCGGHSELKEPTEEINSIVDALKEAILGAAGVSVGEAAWSVVSYTSQVVAGTMFMAKINAGTEHIHAKIFKPLPHTGADPELKAAKGGFTAESDLTPL